MGLSSPDMGCSRRDSTVESLDFRSSERGNREAPYVDFTHMLPGRPVVSSARQWDRYLDRRHRSLKPVHCHLVRRPTRLLRRWIMFVSFCRLW